MVVGDDGGESQTRADQEVAHDGLKPRLARLEIGSSDESTFLLGILNDGGVESVLRRTVQVNDLLLNSSHTI